VVISDDESEGSAYEASESSESSESSEDLRSEGVNSGLDGEEDCDVLKGDVEEVAGKNSQLQEADEEEEEENSSDPEDDEEEESSEEVSELEIEEVRNYANMYPTGDECDCHRCQSNETKVDWYSVKYKNQDYDQGDCAPIFHLVDDVGRPKSTLSNWLVSREIGHVIGPLGKFVNDCTCTSSLACIESRGRRVQMYEVDFEKADCDTCYYGPSKTDFADRLNEHHVPDKSLSRMRQDKLASYCAR